MLIATVEKHKHVSLRRCSLLDVLRPVNLEGSYQSATECAATTSQVHSGSLVMTYSTVGGGIREVWREMKLNESGRQTLGSHEPCQPAKHVQVLINELLPIDLCIVVTTRTCSQVRVGPSTRSHSPMLLSDYRLAAS